MFHEKFTKGGLAPKKPPYVAKQQRAPESVPVGERTEEHKALGNIVLSE